MKILTKILKYTVWIVGVIVAIFMSIAFVYNICELILETTTDLYYVVKKKIKNLFTKKGEIGNERVF